MIRSILHFLWQLLSAPYLRERLGRERLERERLGRERLGVRHILIFAIIIIVGIFVFPALALMVSIWFFGEAPTSKNGVAGVYLAAHYAARQNDAPRASAFYERALNERPQDTHLKYQAFHAHLAGGNLPAAEVLAKQLIKTHPDEYTPHLVLLATDIVDANWRKAKSRLDDLPQSPLNDFLLPGLRGWMAQARGDDTMRAQAQADLQKLTSFPATALFQTALLAHANNDIEAARRAFERGWKLGGELHVFYALTYGQFLQNIGEDKEARRIYRHYAKRHIPHPMIEAAFADLVKDTSAPALSVTARQAIAYEFYMLAESLYLGEHFTSAMYYVQIALKLSPQFVLVQFLRGDILSAQKQWSLAAQAFAKIEDDHIMGVRAQIRSAEAHAKSGDLDTAITLLDSLAVGQNSAQAYISLGDIFNRDMRFARAEHAYSRALTLIKQHTPRQAHIYFSRGVAREQSGNWKAAEADMKRALRLSKNAPHVLNYLAYGWAERGVNLSEALKMLQLAVKREPQNGAYLDSLGWVHFRLGDMNKALLLIERASQLLPNDAEIIDHLGDVLWYSGRKFEARYQWQKAANLAVEMDDFRKLRDKISQKLATGRPLIKPPTRIIRRIIRRQAPPQPKRPSKRRKNELDI